MPDVSPSTQMGAGLSLAVTLQVTERPWCFSVLSLIFICDRGEQHHFQPWTFTCRNTRSRLLAEPPICVPIQRASYFHTLSLNNSLYCLYLLWKFLSCRSSWLAQCPFLWPWQKHSCPVHFRPQLYKSFSWPVVLTIPIIFERFQWFLFPLGHQAYCDSLNLQSPSWLTPNLSLFIHYQNINAQHQSAPDASFNWSIC